MEMRTVPLQWRGTLEKYLQQNFPHITAGQRHKYLRENKIKVNGKKQPLSTVLAAGDEIKLFLPPQAQSRPNAPLFLQAKGHLGVVYEDAALLLVEKPAGLLVADEDGAAADTLINRCLRYLQESGFSLSEGGFLPSLCHRLDTGTSGLVLVAKTEAAHTQMLELIRDRAIEKHYLCVTVGCPKPAQATLHAYLQKDAAAGRVRIFQRETGAAKEIITRYKTLCRSQELALLDTVLVTGRTHQIRAHLASIGCPVLGDSKYGNNTANRAHRFKYQALCAYSLRFPLIAGACAGVSEKTFYAKKPWYCEQMENGTLF